MKADVLPLLPGLESSSSDTGKGERGKSQILLLVSLLPLYRISLSPVFGDMSYGPQISRCAAEGRGLYVQKYEYTQTSSCDSIVPAKYSSLLQICPLYYLI